MSRTELNRFGDTAVRLKNQVKFYTSILNFISDEDKVYYVDEIWLKIKSETLNYNENETKKVSHENFWYKQLRNFGLISIEDNIIKLTSLGKAFVRIISKTYRSNFDVIAVSWFFLMLNTDKKISPIFRDFVKYVYEFNEYTDRIVCSFINSNKVFSSESDYYKYSLSSFEVNEILRTKSLQVVVKLRKKSSVDNSLPNYVSNIGDKIKMKQILDQDVKLKNKLKKSYKIYNNIKNRKKIDIEELINYSLERKTKLIDDVLSLISYETTYKDYKDINERWFHQTNFLTNLKNNNQNNKTLVINENYKKIYINLLEIKFDEKLETFERFINNIVDNEEDFNFSKNDFPYNEEQVLSILRFMNENKWNELKEKFKLSNINNSTIFEYTINLAFSISYGNDIKTFKQWCNTLLDDENKPYSHAPGGRPDGNIFHKNRVSTLETTLIKNLEQIINNERNSIHRHAYNSYNDIMKQIKEYPYRPTTIFVVKENLTKELMYNFLNKNKCEFFQDPETKIVTILLSCSNVISLFESKKLNIILDKMYPLLPLNNVKISEIEEVYYKYLKGI